MGLGFRVGPFILGPSLVLKNVHQSILAASTLIRCIILLS